MSFDDSFSFEITLESLLDAGTAILLTGAALVVASGQGESDSGTAALITGAAAISGSGAGIALTIEEIGGVALDLDPALLTPGTVSTLLDNSGNGLDFSAAGGAEPTAEATSGPNNAPDVRFASGKRASRGSTPLGSLTAADFFAVWKFDNASTGDLSTNVPWRFCDANPSAWRYSPISNNIFEGAGSTTRQQANSPAQDITQWHVVRVTSTSSEWTLYVGTETLFTTGTNTVGWAVTAWVGGDGTFGGSYLVGNMALLVVFDHKLSATDLAHFKANILTKRFGAIPGAS